MDKAVVESGGAGVETPAPLSRWQGAEQIVSWMSFIAHNCGRFLDETGGVYISQGRKWGTNDLIQ